MLYLADNPATIIPTNSMFVLDEHADWRTIQIGGTDSYGAPERGVNLHDTYLYLKGVDNNGEIAYLKLTVQANHKLIIYPGMGSMTIDKNGKVFIKSIHSTICFAEMGQHFERMDFYKTPPVCSYYALLYGNEDEVDVYPNVEELLDTVELKLYLSPKIVKKPEIHASHSAYIEE